MAWSWNPFAKWQDQKVAVEQQKSKAAIKNNNYDIFHNVNNDIERIVTAKSIITQQTAAQTHVANPVQATVLDSETLAVPVSTNKPERINQYRSIANLMECQWCLDEIADEFLHENENEEFISMLLPDRLSDYQKDVLQEEFKRFINLFKFKENGYNIIKRFLVEGELAWENVIKHDHPDMGIVGVRFLPAEYYDMLMDTKTNLPVGLLFDVRRFAEDRKQLFSNNYVGAANTFNTMFPVTATFSYDKSTCIPMLWSQLTYINSGDSSYDGLITYPLIEKSRQAYYQLALLLDAAVILRVTRAPERLLFNVSTGKMTQNYADEYVRRFANSLKSKKVLSHGPHGCGTNDVGQVYDPISKLEHFVFAKSDGNEGTTVETVGSTANYDEIADIEFFLRRFMKTMKVPFARYKTPENTMEKNDNISMEEYTFSRMIINIQRRFVAGLKNSFITHLKLRGIWNKEGYELKDADLNISMMKPVLYDIYETQKLVETKMNIYKSVVENEEFSKITAMKKILKMSDEEIKENYRNLITEKMIAETGEFLGGQVADKGGLAEYQPEVKFMKDVESEQNKDSESASDENEGAEGEEDSEDENEDNEDSESTESSSAGAEQAEPSTPSFGLG